MSVASNSSKAERTKALEEVKTTVKNVRMEVEKEVVEQVAEDIATTLIPGEPIEEGTVLVVLEKGMFLFDI